MCNNGKYELMIKIQQPLVEKKHCIQNNQVGISLYVGNNFNLNWQQIRMKKNYLIQSLDINNHTIFLLFISIYLANNKNKKTERNIASNKLQLTQAIYFIKDFIYKTKRIIAQRVNSWFYNRYF